MRQYQKKINLQLEKERLLAKRLLTDGKKEWVQYYSKVSMLEMNLKTQSIEEKFRICTDGEVITSCFVFSARYF